MTKLIELWKTDCSDCEAVEPIVSRLEKEGYEFDKLNISTPEGKQVISEYQEPIIENNKRNGSNPEYLFTPTFINPRTKGILALEDRPPTEEEIRKLAEG